MSQTRRLAAILAADVAGYSRLMGADEEGTLERLKALRRELLDRKIAEHHGRIVKTTGDGLLVEFASVVDAVRCAVDVQQAMPERDTGVGADNRIELRIGINLGDVIVEGDDLYGDGVNIAVRIEAWLTPVGCSSSIRSTTMSATGCPLSSRIWASSRSRTLSGQCGSTGCDLRAPSLTLPRKRGGKGGGGQAAATARQAVDCRAAVRQHERRSGAGVFRRRHGRGDHHGAEPHPLAVRDRPQFELHL
ncbi:MAG TPA: adenylate/guanylate cyclase domain-containing protein [Stellaceae bacterium]|nr:adenylate/guanylate cyclase domain-containing protein [Stellaceae bacterium]